MSHHGPSSPEPEFLSSGDPATPLERQPRSGRRLAYLVGGLVATVGLVGGAAWAWAVFSSTGPQPSEALPADTLGYAAVDLDPSGQQKIEAFRLLRKFPAFTDEIDLDSDDDLRRRIVEESLEGTDCDVDFEQDVEPWLGMRFAAAAVPGDDRPAPVLVIQVSDAEAAEEGLSLLQACGSGDEGAWEIRGEWAVLAETDEVAEATADAAAEASLTDDETYREWTEAVGDPGVLTAYAAPEAGEVLLDSVEDFAAPFAGPPVGAEPFSEEGPLSGDGSYPDEEPFPDESGAPVPPQLNDALESFDGAAFTVRFADGAVEVEGATSGSKQLGYATDGAGDAVGSLPEDTAVALGFALEKGWGQEALDGIGTRLGSGAEAQIELVESELGIELPADLETLFGESTVFALSSDFDAKTLLESDDGSDVPFGGKIRGDADAIGDIIDKLQAAAGPEGEPFLSTDIGDDAVAVGPDADYRGELLADGDLGGTDAFEDVVPEADAATGVFFVNFDANDWLVGLARADDEPEVAENVEPLDAAGLSSWVDDEQGHFLFRLTTD